MPATIIAAVDSSPASLRAAQLLAGYQGDRSRLAVVALNVQSRPYTLWPGPAIDPGAVDAALLHEGDLQLEPALALLAEAGLETQAVVRLSIPAEAIAEEAARRGAAAIVMGTRGHGALGGFALGSVALRVAHRAQVPTLMVQPDMLLPRALGRSVRAPEPSEPATRDARALLHIARLGHRLHEVVGEPAAQIAQLASQLGSDLIVMGTRGLGALHHALVGSVALKVAHASPVPVALVP